VTGQARSRERVRGGWEVLIDVLDGGRAEFGGSLVGTDPGFWIGVAAGPAADRP